MAGGDPHTLMATITSANVAEAIVKYVSADALPLLLPNFVMGNLVNRDYESTLAQAGDTVNIPIPPSAVANNIVEAGSVQPQAQSLGNAQIVLNTHAESSFTIPDVTKALAFPDLLKIYIQPAIEAIAQRIEIDLLSLYPMFTANAVVGGNSAMDEARIDQAESNLFAAKVPPGQKRYLVLSTNSYGGVRQLGRFSEYQTGINRSQDSPIQTGELPLQVKGFQTFRSQLVPNIAGVTQNLAFARDALALVIRKLPQPLPGTGAIAEYAEMANFGIRIIMSYQPNTLAQQFTVDCLYGVGALRQSFGQVVQSNQ